MDKKKQIRKLNKYFVNTKANILGINIDSPEKEKLVIDLVLEDEAVEFLKKQKGVDIKKAKDILRYIKPYTYIYNLPLYRRIDLIRKVKDLELYKLY